MRRAEVDVADDDPALSNQALSFLPIEISRVTVRIDKAQVEGLGLFNVGERLHGRRNADVDLVRQPGVFDVRACNLQ